MCGIWGSLSSDESHIKGIQAYEAAATIRKRGPERTRTLEVDWGTFVFHRLAINGLEESHDQPYIYVHPHNPKVKFLVMCNGEIYNYQELAREIQWSGEAKCDTEVIFAAFQHTQFNFEALYNLLYGEYALAIVMYDTKGPMCIWMSVDACSVRPLFYSVTTRASGVNVTFSSLLSGVKDCESPMRLQSGEMLNVNFHTNEVTKEKWWNWDRKFEWETKDDFTDPYVIRRHIVTTLEACVARRLHSDR